MMLIGLTGSIGMGKSTIANRFRSFNIPVFNSDEIVHDLYESEAVKLIESAFPETIRNAKVDRDLLSQELMANDNGFEKLQSIVYPLVYKRKYDFINRQFKSGSKMVVLEVPLLFETNCDAKCDVNLVVSASYNIQKARVLQRNKMSVFKFQQIISRQFSDDEKKRRADFIVDTGQSIYNSYAQVDSIIQSLKIRNGIAYNLFWNPEVKQSFTHTFNFSEL
ncbi:MAG: dephospho-CoA kinase [Hyphomicrobiaceae bacterium]|nr:dephospho-CoA kinase [Hyphomicrobiaceae bacterium]